MTGRFKKNFVLEAALIMLIASTPCALAQSVPPANTDAGAVGQMNLYNYEHKEEKKDLTEKKPELNIKPVVNDQNISSEKKKLEFNLTKVNFVDNTKYSDQELSVFVKHLEGRKIKYEEAVAAAIEITKFYREKGYITSMAYIPPQEIVGGVLTIRVLEGKVGEISVKGNKWTKPIYFQNTVFKENGIKKGNVLNVEDLKRSMVNINSQEYLKGKVYLQKGEAKETTDLVLDVKDRVPVGLDVSWDNLGREFIGVQRAGIGASYNNLTGYGDVLRSNVSLAKGTVGSDTSYLLPVGPWGTKLNLGYSYSNVELGGIYKPANIEGSSHFYTIGLIQPIINKDRFKLTSDLGFDFRQAETTFRNNELLNKYQTRVLRAGTTFQEADHLGRWIVRAQASQGLPILGGHRSGLNGTPDSQFFKLNTSITRINKLPFNSYGIARFSSQFANKTLYGSEEMQLGGMYTVRGFEDGSLIGDVGYNASLEVVKPIPYLKDVHVPYWKDKSFLLPLQNRISVAGFYDMGYTKMIHQGVNTSYANFLQGIGAGLRLNITKYLSANLDFGIPLGRKRFADQNDMKFHFSISSKVF